MGPEKLDAALGGSQSSLCCDLPHKCPSAAVSTLKGTEHGLATQHSGDMGGTHETWGWLYVPAPLLSAHWPRTPGPEHVCWLSRHFKKHVAEQERGRRARISGGRPGPGVGGAGLGGMPAPATRPVCCQGPAPGSASPSPAGPLSGIMLSRAASLGP